MSVRWSELHGGEVVSIFGLPDRIGRNRRGPATHALWERVVAEGRAHGSTTLDLDEWAAAQQADMDAAAES